MRGANRSPNILSPKISGQINILSPKASEQSNLFSPKGVTRTLFSPKLIEDSFSQEKEHVKQNQEISKSNPYILSKQELDLKNAEPVQQKPIVETFRLPFIEVDNDQSYKDMSIPEQNNQTFEPKEKEAYNENSEIRPQFDTEKSLGRKDSRQSEIKSLTVIPGRKKKISIDISSPKHNFKYDAFKEHYFQDAE